MGCARARNGSPGDIALLLLRCEEFPQAARFLSCMSLRIQLDLMEMLTMGCYQIEKGRCGPGGSHARVDYREHGTGGISSHQASPEHWYCGTSFFSGCPMGRCSGRWLTAALEHRHISTAAKLHPQSASSSTRVVSRQSTKSAAVIP